jgi:hypothetical protein
MKIYTINDLKLKYKYSEKNIKKRHYKLLLNLLKSVNSGDYDINRYYSLIRNKVEPKNSEEKVIVRTINFIDDYVETTKIGDSTLFLYQSLIKEKTNKEIKTLIKSVDALVMNIENTNDIAELMLILSQIFKEANFPYSYIYIFTILNFYLLKNDISNIYVSVEDALNLQAIEDESEAIKLDTLGILLGLAIDVVDSRQRGVSDNGIILGATLTLAKSIGLVYVNKGIIYATTTIGTAINPGVGTVIGFVAGAVVCLVVDVFLNEWLDQLIDKIAT